MNLSERYNQDALNEIADLFSEAEKAIKYIEDSGGELVVPAINQLRYAGNHIVRYLRSIDNDELRDAAKHAKRATYDAYEAAIVYHLMEYCKFKEDYRKVQITTVIPDFVQIQEQIESATKFIRDNGESKTRGDNYRNGRNHLDNIICKVKILNASREELNKLIVKERRKMIFEFASLIGIIFTFLQWLMR